MSEEFVPANRLYDVESRTAFPHPATVDELSEEEIAVVLETPAFQKSLKYRRLAQGIEVLEEDDAIYRQLVATITEQHGQVSTRGSVEEVLDLFVTEVKTYTEGMDVAASDEDTLDPLEELVVDDGVESEHDGRDVERFFGRPLIASAKDLR